MKILYVVEFRVQKSYFLKIKAPTRLGQVVVTQKWSTTTCPMYSRRQITHFKFGQLFSKNLR